MAILAASKINLETITATIKAREHEELAERVSEFELGSRPRSPTAGTSASGGSRAEEARSTPTEGRTGPHDVAIPDRWCGKADR